MNSKASDGSSAIHDLEAQILCCDFSPETGFILAGAMNGSIRAFDANTLIPVGAVDPPGSAQRYRQFWNACGCCAVAPGKDASMMAGFQFGAVRIFDRDLRYVWGVNEEADANDPERLGIEFSSGFEQLGLKRPGSTKEPKLGMTVGCVFSPDGYRAVIAWAEGFVGVLNCETGRVITCQRPTDGAAGRAGPIHCIYAPDGKSFVTGTQDGYLQEWMVERPRLRRAIRAHDTPISCCAWSPDGRQIATGAYDGTIRLRETADLSAVVAELRCGSRPNHCRFSPDGQFLLVSEGWGTAWATTPDGALSVWDVSTCRRLCSLPLPSLVNTFAIINPELLVAVAVDSQMLLFQASGVHPGPALTTAVRLWEPGPIPDRTGAWQSTLSALCYWCGTRFAVDEDLLAAVAKSDLRDACGTVRPCPACSRALRFNPFVVDGCGHIASSASPAQADIGNDATAQDKEATEVERLELYAGSQDRYVPILRDALACYHRGDFACAEQGFLVLLAAGFDVPSTHCQVVRVYLSTSRYAEARQHIAQAWSHRAEGPSSIVPRILWLQTAMALLDGVSPALFLGRFKTATQPEDAASDWSIKPLLNHLRSRLTPQAYRLLAFLSAAMEARDYLAMLDAFPEWKNQTALPLK